MDNPRIAKLRKAMAANGVDGFLSMHPVNRQYLCGFSGSPSYLIITADRCVLATLFLILDEARAATKDLEIVRIDHEQIYYSGAPTISDYIRELGITRLAYEEEHVTAAFLENLRNNLPGVELVHGTDMIAGIKAIKEPGEIELMRKACAIGDRAFAETLELIRPGATELEISTNLYNLMKAYGADPKFQCVVSAERSALPHGQATMRKLQKGDMITIDMGCAVEGYYSDMTRGIMIGQPSAKQREIFDIVYDAQKLAGEAIRPGVTGYSIDKIARDYIAAHGYGECFGHSLGHGMGLYGGAELPRLCNTVKGHVVLEENMSFSNEPGIYITNWGGWRVEDTVLVTAEGSEVLTKTPKELIIL